MVAIEPQGNLFRVGIPYQPEMNGANPAAFAIVKVQNSEMSQACTSSPRKARQREGPLPLDQNNQEYKAT